MERPTYPISKIGECARTLSAWRVGLLDVQDNIPEYLRLAGREGQRHEEWIAQDLENDYGYTVSPAQYCDICDRNGIHVEYDHSRFKLVGHMDRVASKGSKAYISEFKALGKYTFGQYKRLGLSGFRIYRYQIVAYHAAFTRLPILYVVKSRDSGELNIQEFDKPPDDFEKIISRLCMIEDYIKDGDLAPCDIENSPVAKYSCTKLCEATEDEQDLGFIEDETVQKAAKNYHLGADLMAEGQEIIDEAKGVFLNALKAYNTNRIDLDGINVLLIPEGLTTKYNIPEEVKAPYKTEVKRKAYLKITLKEA